jgi:hypothetical protein
MSSPVFTSRLDAREPGASPQPGESSHDLAPATPGERRAAVVALAAQRYREWFNPDGLWVSPLPAPDVRETVWGMFSLLQGGPEEVALANVVLRQLPFNHHNPTRTPGEAETQFDIFVTNHTVQLLIQHGPKLEPDVRQKLEGWARHALGDYAGDRQSDYQFHGANDNMPAKATLGMILGGEYFGDDEAVEHGLWNLRQLRDLLTRRGLLSEYTSPTYSPLSIVNLTEISLHSRHAEARELAALCAERVWADVLGHFHLPTGIMGGPYSRAYQLDSTGHFSTVSALLWIALGGMTAFNLIEELSHSSIRLVHHHDSYPSQLGLVSWIASCPLEPPAYLLEWLENRSYPFNFRASAERGFEGAGEVNTSFYTEEHFALGTAGDEAWCELQAEVFFLHYRRHAQRHGVENLRTAYCRYLINDQCPGDRRADHLLKPHGVVQTVQEGRVALVLSRPSLALEEKELRSLKFSVILPEHFGTVEKIEATDSCVFIQDGPVYLGLRILDGTDWGRREKVRIEQAPNYRILSFYNYEGEPRRFSREELGLTLNGFVAVIGLKSEENWESFRERVRRMEVLDYLLFGSRTVRCKVGKVILGMNYAVQNNRVRYRTVNGKCAPRPVWEADGMPPERLPFLAQAQPNSLELPFRHLRAVWAPDAKWAIASTGHPPQNGTSTD